MESVCNSFFDREHPHMSADIFKRWFTGSFSLAQTPQELQIPETVDSGSSSGDGQAS